MSQSSLLTSRPPLFPASETILPPRPSHHKKRPASHIPRPPNAFILFRTNFIRDRHLHTSSVGTLTNVSPTSLSTIAGLTWRNMPEEEREIWNEKARLAREEHRRKYPGYRYQPVPSAEERSQLRETKRKVKEENLSKPDLERCQEISRLLCLGIKGQELERRVTQFDATRDRVTQLAPSPMPARSSSLPSVITPPPTIASRSRSYSTSDASYPYPSTSSADIEYPDTPELLPGSGASHSYETYSIAGHALSEVAYDSASPASINLPDLHESVYIPNSGNSSYADLNISPPPTSQTLPSITDHALAPTHHHIHHPQAAQTYSTSYSSLATWDHGTHTNEPAYHPFSYYASTRYNASNGVEISSNIMNTEPQMSLGHAHPAGIGSAEAAQPYASSIPPFELHRKLKSFEQPFSFDYPEFSNGLHTFDSANTYINAVY